MLFFFENNILQLFMKINNNQKMIIIADTKLNKFFGLSFK
jgi:hypothetical protein